jgi:GT2 family glycosyltransferase
MNVQPGLAISIIVPVHSGADSFVSCLASLLQTVSLPHEVIVVADGPAPKLTYLARQCGVKVIELAAASGPARARNRGAAEAQGDILFFVDSDVVVPSGIISPIVAEFEQNPDLAAIIGSYNDQPAASNFLSQYRNLLHHYVHQNSAATVTTFWAGCGAIRRQAFMAVGGFDESYTYPSIEDIELGYRLTTAGYPIRIVKSLQVTHLKVWHKHTMLYTDFWQRALPWTRLLLRYNCFDNNLNIDARSRFSVTLIFLLLLMLPLLYVWPGMLAAAGVMAASLLLVNWRFYHFLWQKRGLLFAAAAVPWHWLYFFYSGLAFILGSTQHYYSLARQRAQEVRQSALRPGESRVPIGEKSAR